MARKTDLIAYCGIYCGSCPAYTQSLANLSKDLRKELRSSKCDKAAPALAKIPAFRVFKHYDKFCEVLDFLAKMRCKEVCRNGGGSAQCRIKKCVKKKDYDGCWQCDDFEMCENLKMLEKYGDTEKSYLKNLRKIKRQGPAAFVKTQSP
jgi:hypothetical protein